MFDNTQESEMKKLCNKPRFTVAQDKKLRILAEALRKKKTGRPAEKNMRSESVDFAESHFESRRKNFRHK